MSKVGIVLTFRFLHDKARVTEAWRTRKPDVIAVLVLLPAAMAVFAFAGHTWFASLLRSHGQPMFGHAARLHMFAMAGYLWVFRMIVQSMKHSLNSSRQRDETLLPLTCAQEYCVALISNGVCAAGMHVPVLATMLIATGTDIGYTPATICALLAGQALFLACWSSGTMLIEAKALSRWQTISSGRGQLRKMAVVPGTLFLPLGLWALVRLLRASDKRLPMLVSCLPTSWPMDMASAVASGHVGAAAGLGLAMAAVWACLGVIAIQLRRRRRLALPIGLLCGMYSAKEL